MNIGKLRIETNGSVISSKWKVYLDETEITKYLTDIEIHAGVNNRIPKIKLVFINTVLDIPDGILGAIELYKQEGWRDV